MTQWYTGLSELFKRDFHSCPIRSVLRFDFFSWRVCSNVSQFPAYLTNTVKSVYNLTNYVHVYITEES